MNQSAIYSLRMLERPNFQELPKQPSDKTRTLFLPAKQVRFCESVFPLTAKGLMR